MSATLSQQTTALKNDYSTDSLEREISEFFSYAECAQDCTSKGTSILSQTAKLFDDSQNWTSISPQLQKSIIFHLLEKLETGYEREYLDALVAFQLFVFQDATQSMEFEQENRLERVNQASPMLLDCGVVPILLHIIEGKK